MNRMLRRALMVCLIFAFGITTSWVLLKLVWEPLLAIKTLDPRFTLQEFPVRGQVRTLHFSPDGEYLVVGTQQLRGLAWKGQLAVFEVSSGKELFSQHFDQWVKKVVLSNDGRYLAAAISTRVRNPQAIGTEPPPAEIIIYEFPAMKIAKRLLFDDFIETICFNPDGRKLAVGVSCDPSAENIFDKQHIEIVDWQKDQRSRVSGKGAYLSHRFDMSPMIFDPQSRLLAKTTDKFELFDLETGKPLERFSGEKELPIFAFVPIFDADFFILAHDYLVKYRFQDYSSVAKIDFSSRGQAGYIYPQAASPDFQRVVGRFSAANHTMRGEIYWEDVGERKTIIADRLDMDSTVHFCKYSPTDRNLFAVAATLSVPFGGNDPVPDPRFRNVVLLYRVKD